VITRAKRIALVTLAPLVCAVSVQAHHSNGMFDSSTPIWVKGTVVRYEPVSPHAMIELEERTADGRIQRWSVEGPFPGRLQRILDSKRMGPEQHLLKAGDAIEVCGFDLRADLRASGVSTERHDASKFMHAPLIVMPDGHMQTWGPYGKLDNCVRPSDRASAWRDFFDTDPLARDLWCGGRRNTKAASVAPKALVDEINALISNRCE